ncbi:MAG: DUF2784 domain-containing protein [Pseudomonadales bacterium]|nr:DUF2784 domain-containing protein [Pseudomonadales bacterium]
MITAADVIVIIHFGFVLFVIFGALLALKWKWMPLLHLPAAIWGALIEIVGWTCPLTPLEQRLREGSGTYEGGFVQQYLWSLLYPEELTRSFQLLLGVGVILINVVIYGFVVLKARGQRQA